MLKLNSLLGHIAWEQNAESVNEVYIPIDGWIALIHREPRFQGLTFHQSAETENNIPLWMECTIYRSDLTHPITLREYLAELKTDHPIWQLMSHRMLRHKSLQQCARLALVISIAERKIEMQINKFEEILSFNNNQTLGNTKKYLFKKLNSGPIKSQ